MSTKITSPIEGFTGRSVFGPVTLSFADGVAETDEKLSDGLKDYLKGRGYKVGRGTAKEPEAAKAPQKNDSTEAWRAWATTQGMTAEQAAALGRDEIIAELEKGGDGS